MENRKEHDERVVELQSLGIDSRGRNELNNKEELRELAENIKQSMYLDSKSAYDEKAEGNKEEARVTVNKF
jgi:hypothetical protein